MISFGDFLLLLVFIIWMLIVFSALYSLPFIKNFIILRCKPKKFINLLKKSKTNSISFVHSDIIVKNESMLYIVLDDKYLTLEELPSLHVTINKYPTLSKSNTVPAFKRYTGLLTDKDFKFNYIGVGT